MAKFNERYWQLWDEARDRNHKLSRQKFAADMGVTPGQSNGWLDNGNQPDCDVLLAVAAKAQVSVSWLVGETAVRNLPTLDFLSGLPADVVEEIVGYAEYLCYKRAKQNAAVEKS